MRLGRRAFVAGCASFLLAGCGLPSISPPSKVLKAQTIKVAVPGGIAGQSRAWTEAIKVFAEVQPNITVQLQDLGNQPYLDTIVTLQSGSASMYDLVVFDHTLLADLMAKSILQPIDDLLAKAAYDPEVCWPNAVRTGQREGSSYGLPIIVNTPVLYYNLSSIKELQMKSPYELQTNGEWTWETYISVAKQFTRVNKAGASLWGSVNMLEVGDFLTLSAWLWANGGALVDDQGFRSLISSKETKDTLNFLMDLVQRHRVAPTVKELSPANNTRMFIDGRVDMTPSSAMNLASLKSNAPKFEWDIAPLPRGRAGQFAPITTTLIGISKTTPNREGAWEVIRFLTGDAFAKAMFKGVGWWMPSLKKLGSDYIKVANPPLHPDTISECLEKLSRPMPSMRNIGQVNTAVREGLREWLDEKATLDTTTTMIESRLNELLRPM